MLFRQTTNGAESLIPAAHICQVLYCLSAQGEWEAKGFEAEFGPLYKYLAQGTLEDTVSNIEAHLLAIGEMADKDGLTLEPSPIEQFRLLRNESSAYSAFKGAAVSLGGEENLQERVKDKNVSALVELVRRSSLNVACPNDVVETLRALLLRLAEYRVQSWDDEFGKLKKKGQRGPDLRKRSNVDRYSLVADVLTFYGKGHPLTSTENRAGTTSALAEVGKKYNFSERTIRKIYYEEGAEKEFLQTVLNNLIREPNPDKRMDAFAKLVNELGLDANATVHLMIGIGKQVLPPEE